MKVLSTLACLSGMPLLFTGCLSPSVPTTPSSWSVEYVADKPASRPAAEGATRGSVRVSQIVVRAPYDVRELTVLRPDGSLAFDPYNQFAAAPATLLKGAVQDAFRRHGDFRAAVSAGSRLPTDLSVETTVTRLALDCRETGTRRACVELSLLLLKDGAAYASADGAGVADAADGNYSRAFSAAFSQAISRALEDL